MNKKINPCGNSMRELSTEELVNIYGADTATPISTIPCSVAKTVSVVSKSVVNSSKVCIGASLSAISGIFSYILYEQLVPLLYVYGKKNIMLQWRI